MSGGNDRVNRRMPVAEHLTESEYKILLASYFEHNRSLPLKLRADLMASEMVQVVRKDPDRSIEVRYRNGQQFEYGSGGEWRPIGI